MAAAKLYSLTLDDLRISSEKYNLKCTDEELKVFQELVNEDIEDYNFVESYKWPVDVIIGFRSFMRPRAENNIHKAWNVKCEIKEKESGKLLGKRVAIKDNIDVACIPMMNGSKIMEGYYPEEDATVVKRILNAGGIICGKTTCEDLCLSGSSYCTTYGPVRNPINMKHSAGGSSSGSGVVVALGEADMAIGGNQGGIRIPASCCGIVGLKPTHGLVPYTGAVPIVPIIDHLGPMTKTVSDCALMLEVIEGYDDGKDYRQNPFVPNYEYSKLIYPIKPLSRKIKVGILQEGVDVCDADVGETFNRAVSWLSDNSNLELQTVSLPIHKEAGRFMTPIFFDGALGCLEGSGYGTGFAGHQSSSLVKSLRKGLSERWSELSNVLKTFVLLADHIKAKHGPYYYAKASTAMVQLRRLYNQLLDENDVIIMPTLNKKPCKLPEEGTSLKEWMDGCLDMIENTAIFDGTGHPALSLNCGFVDGLPIGLMVVGRHYDEIGVLNAAAVFEQVFNQHLL